LRRTQSRHALAKELAKELIQTGEELRETFSDLAEARATMTPRANHFSNAKTFRTMSDVFSSFIAIATGIACAAFIVGAFCILVHFMLKRL
jgi:nitrate/nitrite transporter NarK